MQPNLLCTVLSLYKVYQFMAQKDVKVNIALAKSSAAIAKASKDDSSAMKTIAILGMFFLPGAFVAVRLNTSFRPTSPFLSLSCVQTLIKYP